MYLVQLIIHDILYSDNHLARAVSNPSKAHMGAARRLLRYLAGSIDFNITNKKGGFKLQPTGSTTRTT